MIYLYSNNYHLISSSHRHIVVENGYTSFEQLCTFGRRSFSNFNTVVEKEFKARAIAIESVLEPAALLDAPTASSVDDQEMAARYKNFFHEDGSSGKKRAFNEPARGLGMRPVQVVCISVCISPPPYR